MQTLSLAGMLKRMVEDEINRRNKVTSGVLVGNTSTMISELVKTRSDRNRNSLNVTKQLFLSNLAQF